MPLSAYSVSLLNNVLIIKSQKFDKDKINSYLLKDLFVVL